MKKLLALCLAVVMVLALSACGQSKTTNSGSTGTGASTGTGTSTGTSTGTTTPDPAPTTKFPEKPITFYIPFDAGSAADTYCRQFGAVAEKYFGQSLVYVNKSGASGAVGLLAMLSQPADGYTFAYNAMNAATNIASGQVEDLKEDMLQPLALLCSDQSTIAVLPKSQFNTFEELLDYAKANPGAVLFGGAQSKGTAEILCCLIEKYAGVDFTYITYDSGKNCILGLLGDNVDCASTTASMMIPYNESGEMRILVQTAKERAAKLPNVPTISECGHNLEKVSGYSSWKALFIHPDVPEEILKVYDDVIYKTVHDPEWLSFLENQDQVNNFMAREEFETYFHDQIVELTEIFKNLQ